MIYTQAEIVARIAKGSTANEVWPEIDARMFGEPTYHFLFGAAEAFRAEGMIQKAIETSTILKNFIGGTDQWHTQKTETKASAVQQSAAGNTRTSSLEAQKTDSKR